jgi:soluble lytic murein transglycosylase-like protein
MAAPEERNRRNEDAGETRPNRRAEDSGMDAGTAVGEGGGRSRRQLMKRFRQPLIGLGLAGMAFPLVKATSPQEEAATGEGDGQAADELAAAQAPAGGDALDTEEALAEQIAESREEQERTQHVEQAMERYNIARDLAEDIYDAAREANIEPKLAFGLVKVESTFNERAVSHVGARGLTQVMPRTAAWLVPGTTTQDLYDRQTNLSLGFKYLDQMIEKYKGNVRLALLAYNRGPGTVDGVLRRGGNPDNGYADKVLRG